MAAIEKGRIVVVGDSGVGKTSLVHLICHGKPINQTSYTIGCYAEVKLHDYKAGTPAEKTYFIELWDVGGSAAHRNSRSIFYNPVHGIILVHDLTNRKSQQNLRYWLGEVLNKDSKETNSCFDEFDPEQFADSQIPILVIGTKLDLVEAVREKSLTKMSTIAEECGADEINLDCHKTKHLVAGSGNAVKLSKFFDKVIERRYNTRESQSSLSNLDRRRGYSPYSSTFHKTSKHLD